jgi:acetyltransferase-like isoleucine patch superfamily enzyme
MSGHTGDAGTSDHAAIAGLELGRAVRVLGEPRITIGAGARIVCGDDVVLNSDSRGYHCGMPFPVTLIADHADACISIGAGSRLHGCCVHAWSRVAIGRECLIAAGAQLLDAHGHATGLEHARLRTRLQDLPEPIVIGDYCWIGLGALILKGVRLGEGCIVGAHAVVNEGDYPAFSVIAGVPARVIRTLDPAEVLGPDALDDAVAAGGVQRFTY